MRAWALVASLALNVYVLGAMVFFLAVAYPGFAAVERQAFAPLYRSFTQAIGGAVVPFEFLAFLVSLALYAARPQAVPVTAVHAVTALGVIYFALTFGWHLPAHRPLAAGDNSELSALLSSQWARTGVQLVRAGLLGWMAARAL